LTAVVSMTYRPLTPSSSLNLGGYWYRLSLTRGGIRADDTRAHVIMLLCVHVLAVPAAITRASIQPEIRAPRPYWL